MPWWARTGVGLPCGGSCEGREEEWGCLGQVATSEDSGGLATVKRSGRVNREMQVTSARRPSASLPPSLDATLVLCAHHGICHWDIAPCPPTPPIRLLRLSDGSLCPSCLGPQRWQEAWSPLRTADSHSMCPAELGLAGWVRGLGSSL